MNREFFTIAYDGPALRDGAMDVRDLAPTLLAVGQLLDAANGTLHGEGSQIRVQVKATEPGSFRIDLELVQSWASSVLHLFSGTSATGAANILQIVLGSSAIAGASGASLLWLVKRLRGKSPDGLTRAGPDTVTITIDGESFVVPLQLMRLYQSVAVRDALQKVIEEPLRSDGIESFQVLDAKRVVVEHVDKQESSYFSRPDVPDETLVSETRRSAFSIVSLAFKEDNKWRLYDGSANISVSIEDDDFLHQIDQNAPFSKGDILICDARVTQKRTREGLEAEYVVEKVVEHRPAARQLPLPLEKRP